MLVVYSPTVAWSILTWPQVEHFEVATGGHSKSADAPFFTLRRGAPLSVQIVEQAFIRLRKYAGVGRADGARYQPRLHDMSYVPSLIMFLVLLRKVS